MKAQDFLMRTGIVVSLAAPGLGACGSGGQSEERASATRSRAAAGPAKAGTASPAGPAVTIVARDIAFAPEEASVVT